MARPRMPGLGGVASDVLSPGRQLSCGTSRRVSTLQHKRVIRPLAPFADCLTNYTALTVVPASGLWSTKAGHIDIAIREGPREMMARPHLARAVFRHCMIFPPEGIASGYAQLALVKVSDSAGHLDNRS